MHRDQSSTFDLHPEDPEWIMDLGEYSDLEPLTYAGSLNTEQDPIIVSYSTQLKTLVKECMYENPSRRPRVKDLFYRVREGYDTSAGKREGSFDPDHEARTFPILHPIFANTKVVESEYWRTPVKDWLHDNQLPATPRQESPEFELRARNADSEHPAYDGGDLPIPLPGYQRSRPQVPLRHPHGYPRIDERASVNIPSHKSDKPGSITRNLWLMRYYERMGHMWMGEENYWKMLEAGLDPETYNWGMRIPDPERDEDEEPLSGTEYDEGDPEVGNDEA